MQRGEQENFGSESDIAPGKILDNKEYRSAYWDFLFPLRKQGCAGFGTALSVFADQPFSTERLVMPSSRLIREKITFSIWSHLFKWRS